MRRRAETSRLTLRFGELPKSAETTELNYRTKVTHPRQDGATMVRIASILTFYFMASALLLRLFAVLPFRWGLGILIAAGIVFGFLGYVKFLQRRPPWVELGVAAGGVLFCVLFTLVKHAPNMRDAYLFILCPAVAVAAVFAHFVTVQACAFMAVNERVRRAEMKRWLAILSKLWTTEADPECPELWPYRRSFALLAVALAIGFGSLVMAETTGHASYAPMLGVLGFVGSLPFLWILDTGFEATPEASMWRAVVITWKSLGTFLCYNRHQVEAPGLFRFPTKLLRRPLHRDIALGLTLGFLSTAVVGVSVSSPAVVAGRYWSKPDAPKAEPPAFRLTPVEEQFSRTLPEGERARYFEAKKAEHEAREREAFWSGIGESITAFLVGTGLVFLFAWLGPFAIVFAVLSFTGGRLLRRYFDALEHPLAYEVPPQPNEDQLKAGEQGITPWANRIERIQLSDNKEERKHFYIGTTFEGDIPILLHQSLLYTHAHIMGDTGSGKTALGMTPLITQLIAREDCSVIILDLKGDMALFQACRAEAENADLPFKYFTNITDRASFVFNPFNQSHVPTLNTNQLTQGMLEALNLEYGNDYGRSFFSALNRIVLATYVKSYRTQIRSFRELLKFVANPSAYRDIGEVEDWEKTRHLASIIDMLAQVGPLNVTPDDVRDRPRAAAEQIDMAAVLREKQVVYFYLSSPLEPATVGLVAKLAMFSLLTAAARRAKGEKNRVFVFVDEFQRIVSNNLKLFLQQARSFRINFIFSNQHAGQLSEAGIDLTAEVDAGTTYKQSFRATDAASIKRLMDTSRDGLYHTMQWTQLLNDSFREDDDTHLSVYAAMRQAPDGYASVRVSESVGPLLEKNTILDVSAMPLASFVKFTHAKGFTPAGDWTPLLSEYHITEAVYGRREEADWPDPDDRTVFSIPIPDPDYQAPADKFLDGTVPKPVGISPAFDGDIEKRIAGGTGTPPPNPLESEGPRESPGRTSRA